MSDTPETKACMAFFGFKDDPENGGAHYVNYEFAAKLERERNEARERVEEDRKRILSLLIERDRYKFEAEQKWAMRRELEELLGIDNGAPGDEQFKKGLKALKELVAENKKLKCKKK
jgi:hypothetical protein